MSNLEFHTSSLMSDSIEMKDQACSFHHHLAYPDVILVSYQKGQPDAL